MQIVYLWISKYRNFQDKGFNFNSKYELSFDSQNNILSCFKNENYVDDFFGKQIRDVTGIVGKNGVGKSNILELINYSIKNPSEVGLNPFFIIFRNDDGCFDCFLYDIKFNFNDKTGLHLNQQIHPGNIKDVRTVFFSNIFDNRRYLFSKETIDLSTNQSSFTSFGRNIYNFQQEQIINQVKFLSSPYFGLIRNNDLPMPEYIIFSTSLRNNLAHKIRRASEKLNIPELFEFFQKYHTRYKDSNSSKTFFLLISFYSFISFLIDPYELEDEQNISRDPYIHSEYNERVKKNINFLLQEILDGNFDILELHHYILTTFVRFLENEYPQKTKLVKFLNKLFNLNLNWEVKPIAKGRYNKFRQEFLLPFTNKSCRSFVKDYLDTFGNINFFVLEWEGISTGQVAFLNIFSRFHSILKNVKQKNVLITIDEGDLYFHPNWQLNFLKYLVKGLSEIFGERKLQIILTTHSPFLVSDLPKNNLIFIDKKGEEIEILRPEEIEIETFAANIYSLYSKAFFLENGTISEFSYNKLTQVKKNISEGVQNEISLRIINQIGDPIIKKQFEVYLKKYSHETDY